MRRHSIVLITNWPRNLVVEKTPKMNKISFPLRYVPLISPFMFAIAMCFFLPAYIIASKPDFIVIEPDITILSGILGRFVSIFRKTKFVLDIRSIPVETVGFRGFQKKLWFNASVLTAKKLFDGITIITPLMKKEVCSKFDIDPSKVGVWTSGVSIELFDPENCISDGKELKRKLGLARKFVVFYHGFFSFGRGLTETIEAMKIVRRKHTNVVFFLLGTGFNVDMLSVLIRKENLQENVIIHNPVDQSEVPKFIGMCDICIVPLPDNPFWRFQSPLKLLEYLAMEKVVILTDIPAHRAVVGKAKCGIYISAAKPMEIAKAIEYCYFNKENLEEWGAVGRRIVTEEYTWKKVAGDLENYLISIDDKADLI